MNTSVEDVTLCEGQTVGFASAVVDVQQVDNKENDSDVIINRICRLKSDVRHTVNLPESPSIPPTENLHPILNELFEKKVQMDQTTPAGKNGIPCYISIQIRLLSK